MLPRTRKALSDDQQRVDKEDYLKWFPMIHMIPYDSDHIHDEFICHNFTDLSNSFEEQIEAIPTLFTADCKNLPINQKSNFLSVSWSLS